VHGLRGIVIDGQTVGALVAVLVARRQAPKRTDFLFVCVRARALQSVGDAKAHKMPSAGKRRAVVTRVVMCGAMKGVWVCSLVVGWPRTGNAGHGVPDRGGGAYRGCRGLGVGSFVSWRAVSGCELLRRRCDGLPPSSQSRCVVSLPDLGFAEFC
jgi:hypothetical protein